MSYPIRPLGFLVIIVAALGVLRPYPGRGEEFEGPGALIKKLQDAAKPVATAQTSTDTYLQLNKDVTSFAKSSASLAPADAARQWLALLDRNLALRAEPSQMEMAQGLTQQVVAVLPGPASWPELQKLVDARDPAKQTNPMNQALLVLVVHTLNNVEDRQWSDLASMAAHASNPSPAPGDMGMEYFPMIISLGSKLSTVAKDPVQVEKFWDKALDALEKVPANPNADQGDSGIELPDFVSLLGAAKAEGLLKRALLLPSTQLSKIDGDATQKLARKIALANIEKMQQTPWFLTYSLDGSDLYIALLKRSPTDQNDQAAIYHVFALVLQGHPDDAVKAATAISGADLDAAANEAAEQGAGEQVYDFLHSLLQAQPDGASWATYVKIAADTSHAPEALAFVQESLARKDLSAVARGKIERVLYRALLGVDKVDEGVEQLRALIKAAKAAPVGNRAPAMSDAWRYAGLTGGGGTDQAELMEFDIALAQVGHVQKNAALEAEGLDDAKLRSPKTQLIGFLMETGHNAEAEKLLINEIAERAAQENATKLQRAASNELGGFSPYQEQLVKLAQVYYNAGRWADVLALLDQVPGWGASDLVDIADQKAYSERYTPPSLGLMAARALAETGRIDEARRVLDYVLHVDAGDDAAYELLLKIGQGDLVAKLDALYHQDQFQNRPLIWKATVLLQQGKIAEAEQACKTAITVDPSDGQTGKGDRMRVYSVMADICDAKKDAAQATFFRNVVKAIRLSENADDFYDAGLLTRAVTMYGQALDLFSDAYCIQSRIARQLAELGRVEEAEAHYRKAFELMPVSFGRMESHCFGCERAFQGKTATAIAEKTFTDMLAKDPKKPQLYYLLGYLYMEERRYPEAVTNFHQAAVLDPDYINAWKQIAEIGNDYRLDPDLRDEAAFNLLRLDPAGRHVTPSTENIRNLAKLWAVEEDCVKVAVPMPETLLSLTASAAKIRADQELMKKMIPAGMGSDMSSYIEDQLNLSFGHKPKGDGAPRTAVLANGILSTAVQYIR